MEKNREPVDLLDISPHMVDALLATEDKRFYKHSGIDVKAFWAALWRNLTQGRSSGASTLTMQLAPQPLPRSRAGAQYASQATRDVGSCITRTASYQGRPYSSITSTPSISYSNCYGVETAAQRLFGKAAANLTIEESALLVGLLKGQGTLPSQAAPQASISAPKCWC